MHVFCVLLNVLVNVHVHVNVIMSILVWIHVHVCVTPPIVVGAWLMVGTLWRLVHYYYNAMKRYISNRNIDLSCCYCP